MSDRKFFNPKINSFDFDIMTTWKIERSRPKVSLKQCSQVQHDHDNDLGRYACTTIVLRYFSQTSLVRASAVIMSYLYNHKS